MEGSRRSTTRIGHLSASTKKISKKTKKIRPYDLLPNNTSNRFKFIMTPTLGKTCGDLCRNAVLTVSSGKSRTVDNMPLQFVPSET